MTTVVLAVLVIGISTTFWTLVGLGRLAWRPAPSTVGRHRGVHDITGARGVKEAPTPADVAVLVAAHDEELVIERTIRSVCGLVRPDQVHVVSDGSSDRTADIARACGANVLELSPNRGKAGALAAGIDAFDLCDRYAVVLLLDADTHLADDYLETALPLLRDPDVVAVAGRARTIFEPPSSSLLGRFLVAYRERLYLGAQLLLKFGQAARWANAVPIVPGFASLYRTDALRSIDVSAPGLVIEDFNMTFEVHRKHLGRIEFHPATAVAYTQDPDRFVDYRKQMERWLLGFWQTLRRHGLHRGTFWVALAAFVVELVLGALVWLLALPALLVGAVSVQNVLVGMLLPDYLLTVLAAVSTRRPSYLVLGLAFPLMRVVDSALCLVALVKAWATASSGQWISPTRRMAPERH